jgi:hypothetical protein
MTKEFTSEIDDKERLGTDFEKMLNWDEKEAKEKNSIYCHDCRFFNSIFGCNDYIGMYHKTCEEFKWW